MLCAMDVGNTSTMLGLWEGGRWLATWKLSTDAKKTSDELCALLSQLFALARINAAYVRDVALCNVVPPMQHTLESAASRLFGVSPLSVGPGVKTGIKVRTDNPREVGSDRVTNSVAAFHLYGGPVIVMDFSTATIFDCISKSGDYVGNAIAPGVGISAEALFLRASRLARVELDKPRSAIGKNTVESMQSGLIYGYASLIDGMLRRLKGELGGNAKVIVTGDPVLAILDEMQPVDAIEPNLTLEGLRLIFQMNRP